MFNVSKAKCTGSAFLIAFLCLIAVVTIFYFILGNHISESQIKKAIQTWAEEEWGEIDGTLGYSEITQYRYENQQFSRMKKTVLTPYLVFLNGVPKAIIFVETHTPENVRAYIVQDWSSLLEHLDTERFLVIRCDPSEPKDKGPAEAYAVFEDGSVIELGQHMLDPSGQNLKAKEETLKQAVSEASEAFVFTEIKPQDVID